MSSFRTRRGLLKGLFASATGLALAGCDKIAASEQVNKILDLGESASQTVQGALARGALAREYTEADISPHFRANGSTNPDSEAYQAMVANGFADWTLEIGGLVEQPLSLSLADLRAAPGRTQITRHDCVEGWSAIARWTGAQLGPLLDRAKLKADARYIAFFCADTLELTLDGTGDYYETIGIEDAYHPQTILAYDMNGQTLPVAYGAPIRLRLERQLGYKMAKYIMRIEAIADFSQIALGKGGYWEDRGYQWYAGI